MNTEQIPEITKKKIAKPKQPSTRIKKYHKARLSGHNKEESKTIAGFSPRTTTVAIERTEAYKQISVGDAIQQHISLNEIAAINAETIRQDDDLAARNSAMKMAYERIEPDNKTPEVAERVVIVLR